MHNDLLLESKAPNCLYCGYNLLRETINSSEVPLYTQKGTVFAKTSLRRCQNYKCRASHFYGYSVKEGRKTYEKNILQRHKYLSK